MKQLFALALISLFSLNAIAQSDNPKYDKALAESLGGDDYGLKSYVLAILKTGSVNITDKKTVDSLFKGHMENIGRMAADHKLFVAGPLGKNDKNYRGIFILNVRTIEDAQKLVDSDPAVKAKLLDFELYKWYGSAALGAYLKQHEKIEKKKM
jgi:uncharacterized protein YciI